MTDSKGRPIPKYNQRNYLWFWPLTPDRRGVKAPYHALDVNELLGLPRDWETGGHDNIWTVDHATGGLFRLGDEQWHSLIFFRLSDTAVNFGGAPPTGEAGLWVERVLVGEPNRSEAILP